MQSVFWIFFFCITNVILVSPSVESINLNENSAVYEKKLTSKVPDNVCFDSQSLLTVQTHLRIAILDLDVLAPKNIAKASVSAKVKLMISNIKLLDSLKIEKYNVFVVSNGDSEDEERFKVAFGIPGNANEEKKIKSLMNKNVDFPQLDPCNIENMPAEKTDKGYAVSSNSVYKPYRHILVTQKNDDKFVRESDVCNQETDAHRFLCEKKLTERHILNSIIRAAEKLTKLTYIKLLSIGHTAAMMDHIFSLDYNQMSDMTYTDSIIVTFPRPSSLSSTSGKISMMTTAIQSFTASYTTAIINALERETNHHFCQLQKKGMFKKKYILNC